MLVYWILFILVFFFFLINTLSKNKNIEILGFFISILFAISLGCLRSNLVGTDTPGYVRDMPITVSQSVSNIFEYERDPIFWVFIKFLFLFSDSYTLYFSVLAIVFWLFSALVIKKYAQEIFLGLLIFITFRFSDFYLNAMRQGFSIAIIMYSIKFIFDKKPINFVITVLIASLFHNSALFFMFAYLLQYVNLQKMRLLLFVLFVFVFLTKGWLYNYVFKSLVAENGQYGLYANIESDHGILYLILYTVTFLICSFFMKKFENNRTFNILFNLVYIGLLLQVITLKNVGFARIAVYYTQYFVLIVPMVYKQMVKDYGETKSFAFWSIFVIGLYIAGGPAPGVVPYKFFWE